MRSKLLEKDTESKHSDEAWTKKLIQIMLNYKVFVKKISDSG